jgi:phage baseplate assembly protein W
MPKEFLGAGWGFPVKSDDKTGVLKRAEYEESVRQSIWIILGTAKGERMMRPEFGCGIYDLVFEINSDVTAGRVAQAVHEALVQFEPRIDLLDVHVRPANEGEALFISIDYRVRATNSAFNLVYPFYLEQSAV